MDREKMAQVLRSLRREKGETQAEVAKSVGISASAYAMYETGERVPRDDVKVMIAKHFNRSVKGIFF
ncbi:MAG TPA: helix-turn-helix domain-containing protein [Candidatus Anaerostipes avicola]|uniref:Helix-turn-helix domain-containing protein n=1 Tax=Candidatus Anaerostipes avistercoris TaxID=2838462 RepID=A0A9D2T6Q9_9FIRM|nr:helix-turn-helix domain-containing protein [Candidatus Anaerostipes avistercoris]HJC81913.1 helix-turn-helix domain-containing protein [Candidatus Anaerostipes avicola]